MRCPPEGEPAAGDVRPAGGRTARRRGAARRREASSKRSASNSRNRSAAQQPRLLLVSCRYSTPDARAALLKAFDESRTGVRGLVESGVSSVPEIFRHPDPYACIPLVPPGVSIPLVDLSLPFPDAGAGAAEAAHTWGFFHLVNYHPTDVDGDGGYPARALAVVRAFNELPAAERAAH